MNIDEFKKEIIKLGINLTKEQLDKLKIYCDFLMEYNKHTNLTAIKTKEEIYLKHFYDSLTLIKVIDLTKEDTLLDIGSGAGFPGMVLKIFFPNLHVYLIDSNNKKTKFLEELKDKINVDNIEIINNRIENITKDFLNSIDVVTARAVTNLTVLLELAIPLVKEKKYFIALKGNVKEELNNSLYAIDVLKCKLIENKEFTLPMDNSNRSLIVIQKKDKTNIKDVRPYEKIIKKPLQKKDK